MAPSPHWTVRFNGVPYAEGANGPGAYNCLFFAAWVERERFGNELPLMSEPDTLKEIVRSFRQAEAAGLGWRKVEPPHRPKSGDVVLMAHCKYPSHIGVFVDDVAGGSVLHCLEGQGSALHSRFHLTSTYWRIVGYYRPEKEF